MDTSVLRKALLAAAVILGVWLGARYLLPAALPFLLGTLLAVAAEPIVALAAGKMKLRRVLASGLGVSITLILLAAILWLLGAVAVKELMVLAGDIPDIQGATLDGIDQLQGWLLQVSEAMPGGIRPLVEQTVEKTFHDGTVLFEQVTDRLPGAITGALSWVPKGVLTLFTGILAGFMISVRLPRIKTWLAERMPQVFQLRYLPALDKTRKALGGWLKAQLKLGLVTWGIVGMGFLLLGIRYGPLWALLVALVDAVPVLGTGTVLVPWAVVCFLQGQQLKGIGMLCIYGAAMIVRTVLEPKLVGRHLGLDPLVTLMAFYTGYTFWGVTGMLVSPVLAAAVSALVRKDEDSP